MADLKVYATSPHPCSYLADKEAVTLFLDPNAEVDKSLYSQLSDIGFRRSGDNVYRPHCQNCNECQAARIDVNKFTPTRSQKRVIKQNQDLSIEMIDTINTEECYQLYEQYINQRHADGDMYPASEEQYRSFLSDQWGITRYLAFRLHGELIAIAVIDELKSGLAAVYTFYSPTEQRRSLGSLAVLKQIEAAKNSELQYVYLGYYIEECQKMSYKRHFHPLEVLHDGAWRELITSNV
ncbi:arginine-tRNA-protein transferase [Sinobacterium caligoides]|uniref:Aspartate/glutamate leucyltransferase n=1 Tax=Sinobacterium caligoides TaxID=933926 RepID=A0A3N2DY12_9GAMM|nr:arginyltransferase [Sinobacterium caligoides]ROS04562.1 arginine-tRNA-protein transferase [Sinobacterium caligoides]